MQTETAPAPATEAPRTLSGTLRRGLTELTALIDAGALATPQGDAWLVAVMAACKTARARIAEGSAV